MYRSTCPWSILWCCGHRPPAPRGLHGVPVVQGHRDVPPGHGGTRGCGRGRGRGRGRGHDRVDLVPFNPYDDPDVSNPIPPFTPSQPAGIHFGQHLLRGTMTKAVEFFLPFFYRRNDK